MEKLGVSAPQAIIAAIGVTVTLLGYILWILSGYLTIREHNEFVTRYTQDVKRIEDTNREQSKQLANKVQVDEHAKTDAAMMGALHNRLNAMQAQIDLLIHRSLIQPPPNVSRP